MKKIEVEETIKMCDIGVDFNKKLFVDNGYTIKEGLRFGSIWTDLIAEKNNKKYAV